MTATSMSRMVVPFMAFVAACGMALVLAKTSGDEELAFTPDRSEHHILDPATGHSPPDLSLITLLAPTGTLADGLSTALFVTGPERGAEIATRFGATVEVWVAKNGVDG